MNHRLLGQLIVALCFASTARIASAQTPIVSQPLELTIHMHYADKYVWNEQAAVPKELTRLTGIRLKNVASKVATKSSEQFNLLIASRKLPDIVAGDNLKDNFIRFGMEGAFLPLNKFDRSTCAAPAGVPQKQSTDR
jgi:putative aldouronate transport system substrate-binding protein